MHFTTGQSIGTKLKRVLYSRIVLWGRAEQSALQQNSPTGICYTYTRKWEVDAQRKNNKCRRGGGDDRSTITKMRSGYMKNRTEGDEVTFSLLQIC